MVRAEFWTLIALIDRDALHRFDDESAVAPLIAELSKRDEHAIRGFEEQLAQVLHDLDGRSYADNAGASRDSDDAFLYARCFVVACGQEHYERVLDDPTAMPRTLDEWCEPLLSVAQEAWSAHTGHDAEEWDFNASVSYETGANKANWT